MRSPTWCNESSNAYDVHDRLTNVTASYDGYGRLTGHTQSGAAALSFSYNGLDDRVSQSEGAVVKRFVYDSMGRIAGEYGAGPSAVRGEYIYLLPDAANDNASPHGGDDGVGGYALLTIMTPDAAAGGAITAQYPHSNHLGAPLFSTDASGTVVTPGDHAQPVFPGQLRTRADLYYNRYRDYDPTTGRYVQADPLGLDGDANPYLYANGNPMRYTDPTGEFAQQILKGAISGAIDFGIQYFGEDKSLDCIDWGSVGGSFIMDAFDPMPWGGIARGFGKARKLFRRGGGGPRVGGGGGGAPDDYIPKIKPGSRGGDTVGERFPEWVRKETKDADPTSTCVFCARPGTGTQVDHAIPRATGGNALPENAQLACPHCNSSKGASDFPKSPPKDYVGPWPPSHWPR